MNFANVSLCSAYLVPIVFYLSLDDRAIGLIVFWSIKTLSEIKEKHDAAGYTENLACSQKESEYDQEIPQPHTADQPTHREEELQNIYSNNTSVRQ